LTSATVMPTGLVPTAKLWAGPNCPLPRPS
jgi:hypothetical protein